MSELLAPVGNILSFKAAISSGADAVYLGLKKFGARAYSNNFELEEIQDLVDYAHKRFVKVYVTMNTIVFQDEILTAFKTIKALNAMNVDAIIVQDLALIDYIIKTCPNLEAHISTQVGVDDFYGVKFFKKFGAHRVVLARETSIDEINDIKSKIDLPLEVFIHGALCVSYSGNCLMSGLIGLRSGNRGRCVGSCRKEYTLINDTLNQKFKKCFLFSMKDLNTSEKVDQLKNIDSLKIEGRMKDPTYVANVVRTYRQLLNGSKEKTLYDDLNQTFQRQYTSGYLFKEKPANITNITKPNNFGTIVGKVTAIQDGLIEITLSSPLNSKDIIRIDSNKEISFTCNEMMDRFNKGINNAQENEKCYFPNHYNLTLNQNVYRVKNTSFLSSLEKTFNEEYQRIPLNFYIKIENQELFASVIWDEFVENVEIDNIEKANNITTTKEKITQQFAKLNNTCYFLDTIDISLDDEYFIPVSTLNLVRRELIEKLDKSRLRFHRIFNNYPEIKKIAFPLQKKQELTVLVSNVEQYQAALEQGINKIYYKNISPRNNNKYKNISEKEILIGGYSSIEYYQKKDKILISDYSFNVTNSMTVNILHNLGINRVTLSHELSKKNINDLINTYLKENDGYPNLEMIVYGRQKLMITKYCPLKRLNKCGDCKKFNFSIKDDYAKFPLSFNEQCETTILNSKILNLIDNLSSLKKINHLRLDFTTESYEETKTIIKSFQDVLNNQNYSEKRFNSSINTRGHFNDPLE